CRGARRRRGEERLRRRRLPPRGRAAGGRRHGPRRGRGRGLRGAGDGVVRPAPGLGGRGEGCMSGSPTCCAVAGVRAMDTPEARQRVRAALAAVSGVTDGLESEGSKMIVDYDTTEATVMDVIRALRRIGFLAGME